MCTVQYVLVWCDECVCVGWMRGKTMKNGGEEEESADMGRGGVDREEKEKKGNN